MPLRHFAIAPINEVAEWYFDRNTGVLILLINALIELRLLGCQNFIAIDDPYPHLGKFFF